MKPTQRLITLFLVYCLFCGFKSSKNWYTPAKGKGERVKYTYYSLSYSEEFEQPLWVAYSLELEQLHKVVDRKDTFKEDPNIETGTASYNDYKAAPDYDAGHMLGCRNMQFSCEAMSETFYMSNMSPQHKDLNRIRWAHLEHLERSMVERNGKIYVVCGPVLNSVDTWIGAENQIAVPKHYYKVILKRDGKNTKTIAFLMPNQKCELQLKDYVVSVDSVEALTGINFFTMLPNRLENPAEAIVDTINWQFTKPHSNYGYDKEAIKCP